MSKYYFTFGQGHVHKVGTFIFDRNIVVAIEDDTYEGARHKMFDMFGERWAFQYSELPDLQWFPRGVVDLEDYYV